MELSPNYYGINARTKLIKVAANNVGIVKRIKSRIIQKDAIKLIEMAEAIKSKNPDLTVSLICSSNICSKSKALLQENQIELLIDSED